MPSELPPNTYLPTSKGWTAELAVDDLLMDLPLHIISIKRGGIVLFYRNVEFKSFSRVWYDF